MSLGEYQVSSSALNKPLCCAEYHLSRSARSLLHLRGARSCREPVIQRYAGPDAACGALREPVRQDWGSPAANLVTVEREWRNRLSSADQR